MLQMYRKYSLEKIKGILGETVSEIAKASSEYGVLTVGDHEEIATLDKAIAKMIGYINGKLVEETTIPGIVPMQEDVKE